MLKNYLCVTQNLYIFLSLFHGYIIELKAYYVPENALNAFLNTIVRNIFHNPIKKMGLKKKSFIQRRTIG